MACNKLLVCIAIYFVMSRTCAKERVSKFLNSHLDESEPVGSPCNYTVKASDLYEIHVLTFYINKLDKHDHEGFRRGVELCPSDFLNSTCNIQSISKEKLLLQGPIFETDKYLFNKVEIHISNGFLVAETSYKSIFRVLINNNFLVEMGNRGKCPSREWLESSIRCFMLSGDPKVLPIEDIIRRSNLTTFFAILAVSNKHVWPLHIRTVQKPLELENKEELNAVWIFCFVETVFLAICVFLFIYFNPNRGNKQQDAQTANEPGVIEPIDDYEACCGERDIRPEHAGYGSEAANEEGDDANNYINVYEAADVDSSQYYYNEPNVNAMNPNDFPISADAASSMSLS